MSIMSPYLTNNMYSRVRWTGGLDQRSVGDKCSPQLFWFGTLAVGSSRVLGVRACFDVTSQT